LKAVSYWFYREVRRIRWTLIVHWALRSQVIVPGLVFQEKPLSLIDGATVPQTDTGSQGE
jgi:hypothetical protein